MSKPDLLREYRNKRNFGVTSEPRSGGRASLNSPSFVIQKHWASRLHYDFRLELDGVMKSWAVPKGPSLDPADKRMAVHVEDHPLAYNDFEGEIPEGQYGAGKVIIWDRGTWEPEGDAEEGYRKGKLAFTLNGYKVRGKWVLVRMNAKDGGKEAWLLIKDHDEYAKPALAFSVVDEMPDSVAGLPATHDNGRPARRRSAPAQNSGMNVITGTPRAALPQKLEPELATLATGQPPADDDWIYEVKFDGYRLLTRIEKHKARLVTRNGHDWTQRLPELAEDLESMRLPDGWYDGEIVVPGPDGLPDFQALQNAFDRGRTSEIIYYLFDLPYGAGHDLRGLSLLERRSVLEALLNAAGADQDSVRFSAAFDVDAGDVYASACHMGLEGVIGKKKSSHYVTRRSTDWLKFKCGKRQEFVIGGYTDPKGSRAGIGSLLLGVHDDDGALRYAGKVGTGFDQRTLKGLRERLEGLASDTRPFAEATGQDREAHWVRPELVAEVSFAQWTRENRIRHSVFHGLRADKPAQAITRETGMPVSAKSRSGADRTAPSVHSLLGGMKITHPERIVDKQSNASKIAVMRYYALAAPLILEHLRGRPVAMVRAPEGVGGQMFFQKHMDTSAMPGVHKLPERLDPGNEPLLEIANEKGLLSAAQMNALEFHTWNAVKTSINRPDRMTFDLDPGKGVEWPAIQEAAMVLHAFLQQLELPCFAKTSGGKGLHVVVPLQRRHDWDTVKGFSQAIVQHLASTLPARFAAKSGPRNRVGKIFIDYLRNGFGATTVAAWSLRARPGLGISVPVAWTEVEKLHSSAQWHIGNVHERLDQGNKPWADYNSSAKTLTQAMKTMGYAKQPAAAARKKPAQR